MADQTVVYMAGDQTPVPVLYRDIGGSQYAPAVPTNVGGPLRIGDDANARNTLGLTINQGAVDDEVLSLKSSDVAHGVTALTETDTYGTLGKADPPNGSFLVTGYCATTTGLFLRGVHAIDDTAKSAAAAGAITVRGHLKSGASVAAQGAAANVLVVQNGSSTRALIDAEGDLHLDATSNNDAWDDEEDAALLESFRVLTANPPNLRRLFADDIRRHAQLLHDTGVLTLNDDGHHFVSIKGLFGLMIDSIRQATGRVRDLEAEIEDLRSALPAGRG